jgi:hypothetical protein
VPGITERSEFLRGPKWRTRTTARRRSVAAGATFAVIVAFGAAIMIAVMWLLDRLGAPGSIVAVPWIVPTVAVGVWAQGRPGPAVLSDDDDESWSGYAIRSAMVGRDEARARPARIVTTAIFGAPLGWALAVLFLIELTGIM